MNNKMCVCNACGQTMARSAKNCPHCGAKNKKPIFTKWWFWLLVVMFVSIAVSAGSGVGGGTNGSVGTGTSAFDGDCGITAVAEIGPNIINFPELSITITNTSDKDISAIRFYAVPYDVYGDEIKGWTTQSRLDTDDTIAAGKTKTISYQLIEQSVKTVKLYVYSVYFADGTEWGNKDASVSKILNGAPNIEVEIVS